MTDQPTVVCVMLVNGRPEMTRRAIASFRAQTYERKRLLIYDTSEDTVAYNCAIFRRNEADLQDDIEVSLDDELITVIESCANNLHCARKTIGYLRNCANRAAIESGADLIAHWDSDDWSHPRRLEEQVALIESSGKMCVGYRELLFWDTRNESRKTVPTGEEIPGPLGMHPVFGFAPGEAWLYHNPEPRWATGASFLYRRELWEQQPFNDAPHEDQRWRCTPLVSRNCVGVSSVWTSPPSELTVQSPIYPFDQPLDEPRMIAEIHGGNTEDITPEILATSPQWKRAADYDEYCAEVMRCA